MKIWLAIGSAFSGLGVMLGAFGAHALKARLEPAMLEIFEVGVRYQMYHALGLLAVAFAASQIKHGCIAAAGWLFVSGILIFSGSLYTLSLSGIRWLGAITPIGGVCFIAGWACLVWGALASR
ncbi:MAG: DUF423 domain-containing protein [Myxococcota bacterium]